MRDLVAALKEMAEGTRLQQRMAEGTVATFGPEYERLVTERYPAELGGHDRAMRLYWYAITSKQDADRLGREAADLKAAAAALEEKREPPPHPSPDTDRKLARAVEALRPFAEKAQTFGEHWEGHETQWCFVDPSLTIGDLRHAAAVYTDLTTAPAETGTAPDIKPIVEAMEKIEAETETAKAYAEECGLQGGPLPSPVHIKLDMIKGYAKAALDAYRKSKGE